MPVLEGRHGGARLILPVKVYRPYPETDLAHIEGRALIDTGSTVSGVANTIAEQLALETVGKRPLVSALQIAQADRYMFRLGFDLPDSGGPAFPYIFPAVMGFGLVPTEHFDVLIGMDILRVCDLTILRTGNFHLAFG